MTTRASVKEKYRGAVGFLERIRAMIEDVRDVLFIFTLSNYIPATTCITRYLYLDD